MEQNLSYSSKFEFITSNNLVFIDWIIWFEPPVSSCKTNWCSQILCKNCHKSIPTPECPNCRKLNFSISHIPTPVCPITEHKPIEKDQIFNLNTGLDSEFTNEITKLNSETDNPLVMNKTLSYEREEKSIFGMKTKRHLCTCQTQSDEIQDLDVNHKQTIDETDTGDINPKAGILDKTTNYKRRIAKLGETGKFYCKGKLDKKWPWCKGVCGPFTG